MDNCPWHNDIEGRTSALEAGSKEALSGIRHRAGEHRKMIDKLFKKVDALSVVVSNTRGKVVLLASVVGSVVAGVIALVAGLILKAN
jgi:hypothetical protein